jgi:lincosamide nucleotidyltransferase A/C/D/E
MAAEEVKRLLTLLQGSGVEAWIDGGWGVDALLGTQVREHDDLDLIVAQADVVTLMTLLQRAGYRHVAGSAPKSFVFVDADGRQVDVHPVVFDEGRGGGVYLMEDGREWVYPSAGFAGEGQVGGQLVRCLSPEVQVLVHSGYELTAKDHRELQLLHERFGVALPDV